VVAFELLTGSRPFDVDHPAAQARAHVQDEVPAASEIAPGLPRAVDAVLRAGMAKDPAERPASAEALVDHLEDALGDAATAVVTPPTAETRPIDAVPPATTAGVAAAELRRAAEARDARFRRPPTTGTSAPVTPASGGFSPVAAGRRRWPAVMALAALLLAAGTVAAVALTGGGRSGSGTSASGPGDTSAGAGTTARGRTTSSSQPTTSTATQAQSSPAPTTSTATGATSADPAGLNDQGFKLLQQGNPAAAVPVLQQSVAGFRAQGRTKELTYAFALFNLASGLRATGHPTDAIPLLQERLRISDNQRPTVEKELALARADAGQGAAPQGNGKGAGKAKGTGKGDKSGPGSGDDRGD
jgi:serine/threonine-protein kinase